MEENLGISIIERVNAYAASAGLSWVRHDSQEDTAAVLRYMANEFVDSDFLDYTPLWRVLVIVTGSYPNSEDVQQLGFEIQMSNPLDWVRCILLAATRVMSRGVHVDREFTILREALIVDADISARTDHNTGIQRVVRNVCKAWRDDNRQFEIGVWDSASRTLRLACAHEYSRVTRWGQAVDEEDFHASCDQVSILPLGGTLFLMEVPNLNRSSEMTALARFSGVEVVVLGYDLIPLTGAEFVPPEETEKLLAYLATVKYSRQVIAISESAAAEFQGFGCMLEPQGLRPPGISSLLLPIDKHFEIDKPRAGSGKKNVPLVLCLGSIEPRKNQLRVLAAAEKCWHEGLHFELRFVGGGNSRYATTLKKRVRELAKVGHHAQVSQDVDDVGLDDLFQRAEFTVFVSRHEGYGLPIAESFAYGKPAIVSNYGSMREVGIQGPSILVDPQSTTAIADAMKQFLTHSDLNQLSQIEEDRQTWADYASDLWKVLSRESA